MVKEVIWLPNSVKTYNNVLRYLSANWEPKVTDKFISNLKKKLILLEKGNVSFRILKPPNVYEVLITKHNLLIYREKGNAIELLRFYDTRQHPKKKKI